MVADYRTNGRTQDDMADNVAYIRQMLGELRQLARGEKTQMLCYLIEMAYVEAGEIAARNTASGEVSAADAKVRG